MDETVANRDYRELTNIALEDTKRYIQRYYLNKKDMQSEDSGDICIMMAMRRSIDALMKELDRVTSWILVEDQLPEKNATYYLVITMRSPRAEMAWYLDGDWFWNNSDSRMGAVIAWMPLPELYRLES